MKKHLLALAVSASVALPGLAIASEGDYQTEIGFQFQRVDVDNLGDDTAIGVDATYHFPRVNTAGHPLAEAAFLERSSNIGASYVTYDDLDLDVLSLSGEAYVENFYAAAQLTRNDNGNSTNDIGVRVGFLPSDGLLLTLGFDKEEDAGPGGDDLNIVSLGAKYVSKMANDTAFNLEGELSRADDDDDTMALALAGDYYFNRQFSLGLRLVETDNSDIDTAYGVGTRYFFTPVVSGELEYMSDDETDIIWARLAARF